MSDDILDHPAIPKGCVQVKAHSQFGKQVGYVHLIDATQEVEKIYYLGLQLETKHSGAPGRGHGGVTMTMLDEVMGRAASKTMGMLCYTASMTTNFCAGTTIGDFLLATATVSRSGKNLAFVDGQLHSGDRLIATATGTWANSGYPIPQYASFS